MTSAEAGLATLHAMTPTPNEQKALAFLAAMLLLGGAVRVLRAGPPAPVATSLEQQALGRQATAAESSAAAQHASKGRKGGRRGRGRSGCDGQVTVVAGVASVPCSDVRPDRPFTPDPPPTTWSSPQGYPPPGPRVDSWSAAPPAPIAVQPSPYNRKGRSQSAQQPGEPPAGVPLDLDTATEPQIESLPRIGPALARRIVANRDSFGAFRTLESLHRVKGMGPATLARLGPLVSFSGRAAVPTAVR